MNKDDQSLMLKIIELGTWATGLNKENELLKKENEFLKAMLLNEKEKNKDAKEN